MRTEAEFIRLVEARLDAAPKRRAAAPKAVLIAATMAVLACAAVTGAIAYKRTIPAPDSTDSGLDAITTFRTEEGEPETVHTYNEIVTAPAVSPVQPDTAPPESTPASIITSKDTVVKHADTTKAPETVLETPVEYPVPTSMTYNGISYDALFFTAGDKAPLTMADLGDAIGENLYALTGVSTDYMIVYVEDNVRWRYLNRWYRPDTLGDLIEDLNLAENLEIGSLWYDTFVDGKYRSWRVDGLDSARLWDMLFAYPDSKPQELWRKIDPEAMVKEYAEQGIIIVSPPYDPTGEYIFPRTPEYAFGFSINLPKFGFYNISISLSDEDNGWLWTNILASGNYFATSPDLCDDIFAYAREAGTWVDTTPNPNAETVKVAE